MGFRLKIGILTIIGVFFTATFSAVSEPSLDFPEADFQTAPDAQIRLGQLLFYDPLLGGNKTIACATCHHPKFATTDGVSLAIGEGGTGLGPDRQVAPENTPEQRIGRNAPALFNLGASEFTTLFHDGRLEKDASRASGLRTPLADEMVQGFESLLSAQAMFPVLSADEMAGHYSENDVSRAVRQGLLTQSDGAWGIIADRVQGVPEYREMFTEIIGNRDILFTDISNVIADFIAAEWRSDDSPFDRYLKGEPMDAQALAGLELFYGKAGCSACHAGRFQTDHKFHAIAMPQFGPGKAARFESHNRDTGRMRVTGRAADAYKFRTPSLRNVTETGPYGHDGAYATLEGVIRHHLDPVGSLNAYDRAKANLPYLANANDWEIMESPSEIQAIAAANELMPTELSEDEVDALLRFLTALRDETSLNGRLGSPATVPSGLPVD